MCKHKYEHDFILGGTCEWLSFFADIYNQTNIKNITYSELPIDSEGYCLFHSEDLQWKRDNNFVERLTELMHLLNNDPIDSDEDIAFVDFIMVGNCSLENNFNTHKYHLEAENENIMYFKNTYCKKYFRIQHARFVDPVVLEKCFFKYDLILDNCVFESSISARKVVTGTDLYIENTAFNGNLVLDDKNRIYSNLTVLDSTFLGRTNFSGLTIEQKSVVDSNNFGKTTDYVNFNCAFDGGFEFSRNEFFSICFDCCSFFGDSSFMELNQKGAWQMFQPTISGKMAFIGTEDNLLFNSKTALEITSDCFDHLGHVIFDYCNIKDLGTAFIANIKELELMELVEIHPSCRIDRLTVVYEYYPYSNLKKNIIEDFVHLITRYFSKWHAVNLSVNIYRDKRSSKIKIVFKTVDNITDEEFNHIMSKFSTTIVNAENMDSEIADIVQNFKYMVDRLAANVTEIGVDEMKNILTLNNSININLKVMGSIGNLNMNDSQIGIVSTGDHVEIKENTPVLNKTVSGSIDYNTLSDELQALIRTLQHEHDIDKKYIEVLKEAVEAANEKNENKLIEILSGIPKAIFEFSKNIGAGVLANFISAFLGI